MVEPGNSISNRHLGHLKLLGTKVYAASCWVLRYLYNGCTFYRKVYKIDVYKQFLAYGLGF